MGNSDDSNDSKLNLAAIPQADRVERVLEYAVLTHHRQIALRSLLFQGRDALYYRSAAQLLGLLDAEGAPSEGIAGLCDNGQDPIELLRERFHGCPVGLAWARWANVPLWQVGADSAEEFLAATTKLSLSTRARRAKSLQAWLNSLRPEQAEAAPAVADPTPKPTRPIARSELPSVMELGLPRGSRELFGKLVHESVGDWDALIDRCDRHTARFEAQLVHNEFLPVQDARNILTTLRDLVARVRDDGEPLAQRLVWVLGRYYEIAEDGERDFAIGGLDDDIGVFNAVTRYLGMDELTITFS